MPSAQLKELHFPISLASTKPNVLRTDDGIDMLLIPTDGDWSITASKTDARFAARVSVSALIYHLLKANGSSAT